jgi:hypothetical protein
MGSSLGETPRATYISRPLWYLYAGCRPVLAPGHAGQGNWKDMDMEPEFSTTALAALDAKFVLPGMGLRTICPRRDELPAPVQDAICSRALAGPSCRREGDFLVACDLSAADRRELLAEPR